MLVRRLEKRTGDKEIREFLSLAIAKVSQVH